MSGAARPHPDAYRLFATRIVRLFAYGSLSVVLALYLEEVGLSEAQIGLLLTLTLLGDTAVSLWLSTNADRLGRRRMLIAGAWLMLLAGIVFAITTDFTVLLIAAILGVISPSGNEVGPFLPIEQASLAQLMPGSQQVGIFAWYNLVGSFATALGALCGGAGADLLQAAGIPVLQSYRVILMAYAGLGALLGLIFWRVSPAVEVAVRPASSERLRLFEPGFGLGKSRGIVLKLSALFALDAFGGGFIIQSLMAYWFHLRFGVSASVLGSIFFGANILAGISALAAASLARRIGLINTMVFTHIPSNIMLMFIPFMPSLPLAIGLLLIRFSISQMDVPTRQAYVMAAVNPEERSAASGITGVARTIGAALSPGLAGLMLASPALLGAPFLVAGVTKIVYDVSLYASFRATESNTLA